MKVLGFNFNRIAGEKMTGNAKDVKINTGVDITDVSEVKSELFGAGDKIVSIKFTNKINYEPGYANIDLSGTVLLSIDQDTFDSVFKEWENKTLPPEFRLRVLNLILKKSSLKALQLEEELNLPLHMPMPHLKAPSSTEQENQ